MLAGLRSNLKKSVNLLNGLRGIHSSKIVNQYTMPAEVIIPEKQFDNPWKLGKEHKLNTLGIVEKEAIIRLDKDNRSRLFQRRAAKKDRLMPGDVVLVESINSMTNPDFTTRFVGVCIAINRRGIDTSFTLRNVILKVGVELSYKAYSPLVKKIEILRKSDGIRRAKLYYLRDRAKSVLKAKDQKRLTDKYLAGLEAKQ